ncbi:MAG TPA: hypothetical protein DDW33_11580 [Ktedonobacter sp.]|jgi:hypothetical protein|nr:hypothetical protein [Ktedonobacter sp.]HBE26315.1 hypothetical protein [Ktedonobacter sp.]HCF87426.1 hypothetical protein [Ktedonobacter sp.]HCJ35151.1 hypothetical protein [Ktedonobacter sp.]
MVQVWASKQAVNTIGKVAMDEMQKLLFPPLTLIETTWYRCSNLEQGEEKIQQNQDIIRVRKVVPSKYTFGSLS